MEKSDKLNDVQKNHISKLTKRFCHRVEWAIAESESLETDELREELYELYCQADAICNVVNQIRDTIKSKYTY